jgi:hypothetical protein
MRRVRIHIDIEVKRLGTLYGQFVGLGGLLELESVIRGFGELA